MEYCGKHAALSGNLSESSCVRYNTQVEISVKGKHMQVMVGDFINKNRRSDLFMSLKFLSQINNNTSGNNIPLICRKFYKTGQQIPSVKRENAPLFMIENGIKIAGINLSRL